MDTPNSQQEQCQECFETQVHMRSFLEVLHTARHLSCRCAGTQLKRKAMRFVVDNFMDIVRHSADFKLLTADNLVALFKNDDLNVASEDDACEAMLQWVAEEPENRAAKYPQLLEALRLGLVTMDTLKDRLLCDPLVDEIDNARELVQKGLALSTFREELGGDFLISHWMLRPRVPSDVLFVVGGWPLSYFATSVMEKYDDRAHRWFKVMPEWSKQTALFHAMVALDGWLYLVGGWTLGDFYSLARKFDPVTKRWHDISPPHEFRRQPCAAALNGQIYVCGGSGVGSDCSETAERYTPGTNQWEFISNMSTGRAAAGACALNDKIYVAGGTNRNDHLNSAEVYDPSTDQWTDIEPMNLRRGGVALVSFMNSVFAIGGHDGVQELKQVERYFPEQRRWVHVRSMRKSRSSPAAAVVNQRIFAIGGSSGRANHVEWYDVSRDAWVQTAPLNIGRSGAGACVVPALSNARFYNSKEDKAMCDGYSGDN